MTETTLYPQWKQAAADFLKEGFKSGDLIPHTWFEQHFNMEPLNDSEPLLPQEFQARQFAWLRDIEALRTELLEEHQICLASVFGEGYRVVPPAEQTEFAQDKFERESRRTFRQAALRLRHVRVGELTDAQLRENRDAISKLSMLKGMVKTIGMD